jgi:hypothetical protein
VRDGSLGLSHFKLLKRLGCGDIGSVYLAELRGSHSHFAMKVRDLLLLLCLVEVRTALFLYFLLSFGFFKSHMCIPSPLLCNENLLKAFFHWVFLGDGQGLTC